jgi:hypothetical protein
MNHRKFLALAAAVAAVVLAPTTAALAAGAPTVSVRVEGKTRTLLATKTVRTHTGSITTNGAPAGACSATSAAGALDIATHHRWSGTFETSFNDFELFTVLGETWKFTSPNFWGVFVNNRFASAGICGTKLHNGDQLLFAADPSKHQERLLGLSGPAKPKLGRSFSLKVVAFTAAGVGKPIGGAHVHGSGVNGTTNNHGVLKVTPKGAGSLTFHAEESGFIRAAALRVKVVK